MRCEIARDRTGVGHLPPVELGFDGGGLLNENVRVVSIKVVQHHCFFPYDPLVESCPPFLQPLRPPYDPLGGRNGHYDHNPRYEGRYDGS